jgi:hypothetical protein
MQMKKTLILADPEISRNVLGNGMRISAGHGADGNELAVL